MEPSFSRYLLSKQTVDDRALNRHVYETLLSRVPAESIDVIEVGAGIGTMAARLLRWGLLTKAYYRVVDSMQENIDFAQTWLPQWAAENSYRVESLPDGTLRLVNDKADVTVSFVCADVFDFIHASPPKSDLLIAHAFLDLLPMPESLPKLLSLLKPDGLAWLTLNFDGVTTLEPVINAAVDAKIEQLYHQTMDERPSGGDSRTGRHLFRHLRETGADVLAAGASDWVVYPENGQYPADEAYFLHFILHFFEQSLAGRPELDSDAFAAWLKERRSQVDRGELVYIAHQMDFLVQPQAAKSV
jgi:SAM-dependent methyltransferase